MKNLKDKSDSGAYAIVFFLPESAEIEIAKLGKYIFKKGYYVYSGSAKKNLKKRVERHLRKTEKKLRWHIDFFINNPLVKEMDYFLIPGGDECIINKSFIKKGGEVVIKKFGASDCNNKCLSHFLYLGEKYGRMHLL